MTSITAARRPSHRAARARRWSISISRRTSAFVVATLLAAALFTFELRTSRLQSLLLSNMARGIHYAVLPSPGPRVPRGPTGPYDQRLGYDRLPERLSRFGKRGFAVVSQASPSPLLASLTRWGLPPLYQEKDQAGLRIEGCMASNASVLVRFLRSR